jgi:hypothetical protein
MSQMSQSVGRKHSRVKWRKSVKSYVVLCQQVEEEVEKAKISLELGEMWIRRHFLEGVHRVKRDGKTQHTLVLLVC